MSTQIIPLTTDPNQTFQTTLTVDDSKLTLKFFLCYNTISGYWLMNITNVTSDTLLLSSIPLLMDDADEPNILRQYAYLKIGSCYLKKVTATTSNSPDDTNLGTAFKLYWGDTPS